MLGRTSSSGGGEKRNNGSISNRAERKKHWNGSASKPESFRDPKPPRSPRSPTRRKLALSETKNNPIIVTSTPLLVSPPSPPRRRRNMREMFSICRGLRKDEVIDSKPRSQNHEQPHNSVSTALTSKPSERTADLLSTRSMKQVVSPRSIKRFPSSPSLPAPPPTPPPLQYQLRKHDYFDELGYMHFDCETMGAAQDLALRTNKPMMAIETRIPGDVDAGHDIFSHPLIVEASRSLFATVARVVGEEEDEAHRRRSMDHGSAFVGRSPSGKPHRTKVLFLDPHTGGFLTEPLYGDKLALASMVSAMCQVLNDWPSGSVPKYLSLLCEEEMGKVEIVSGTDHAPKPRDYTAFFAMEENALGEVEFAGLDGVFATHAVFINGRRAVQVFYDSSKIAYCSLVRYALHRSMVSMIYYKTNDEKRAAEVEIARVEDSVAARLELLQGEPLDDYDPKKALRKTPLRFVPLTDIQATRANRLVHLGRFDEAMHLLSPQQGAILMKAMRLNAQKIFHSVIDVPIGQAWKYVSDQEYPRVIPGAEFTNKNFATLQQGRRNEDLEEDDEEKEEEKDFFAGDGPSRDLSVLTM